MLLALLTIAIVTGCGPADEQDVRPEISLVYVNWADAIALTNLTRAVLEDSLDYRVTLTMADVAPVFTSLAQGDKDAFVDVWLPVTHADYIQQYGKDLVDLGPIFEGARIGLVVPAYVTIDSITRMNTAGQRFGGKIIGIDSGAGIMRATERAIEAYGLDYELIPSSGAAMTASLHSAIQSRSWTVVTGWRPHWMFARWDLKFLEDPQAVYGREENIHAFARKGLEQDHPDVAGLLRRMKLDATQLNSLMEEIEITPGEPVSAARTWIGEHRDLVSGWLAPQGQDVSAPGRASRSPISQSGE